MEVDHSGGASGAKLVSAVGMNDEALFDVTNRDGVAQRQLGQQCDHAGTHRVAHDVGRPHVFDCDEVELALGGGMFGDVGQPQLVRILGGEVTFDQVIMCRRSGLRTLLSLLVDDREDLVLVIEPLDAAFGHLDSSLVELISNEPIPELGGLGVDVDDSVHEEGLGAGTQGWKRALNKLVIAFPGRLPTTP